MNISIPDRQNAVAAQYVIGTLRGRARDRFERLLRSDQELVAAVVRWENYFSGLNDTVDPKNPPAYVLTDIERRLFSDAPERSGVAGLIPSWWRGLAMATTAMSLALIGYIALPILDPPQDVSPEVVEQATPVDNYVSVLQGEEDPVWSVRVDGEARALLVNAVGVPPIAAEQDYQLWLLRDNDQPPLPLGLLPASGQVALDLPDADLATAKGIAVSLEPKGGSPTDVPTGEVLYVAGLVKAG